MSEPEPLLSVENLTKHYPITEGIMKREIGRVRAVDGISFDIHRGETLGLVGESGCGKSTAATTLLRLEEPTAGTVTFDGRDITSYDADELKRFRRRAQMIFQDPTSSFDPRMTVGESVAEPLLIHGIQDRDRRRRIVQNLLERVGLAADDIDRYPHEFSGGQKQRIAFARALVVNPELVVADEPISALDVSVQAEILSLMEDLQADFGLSILFISHDMSVVQQVCDRVAVMYLGEIVEIGPTAELFEQPQHPYTRALLSSIPEPDPRKRGRGIKLTGDVPDPSDPPPGCLFHTRCPEIIEPEEYDFEQAEWRAVMDLRVRLRDDGISLDAVEEFVDLEAGHTAPPTAEIKNAIRAEFGIPETLSNAQADRVLDDALEQIIDGEPAAAETTLREAFPTVCEHEAPTLMETAADHTASCHLHDERYADESLLATQESE
ncbi:MAG: oligopeptide/dipeptide ABC transporter ATP-binding protein [Halobacteriales archaeon]|nr:oligopeptide/dipeptide ABC transporter ATP-binding protein [Halobacteriales archaeon]